MPRNYNTTGGYTGVSGSGRAYTPQVTPWERDDDDSAVIRGRDYERGHYSDRQLSRSDDRDRGRQTRNRDDRDGDVWNRRDLTPTNSVLDRQDRDREPHRDDDRYDRSDRDGRHDRRDDDRRYARDNHDDTRQWDDRAWDRDNGVHHPRPYAGARQGDDYDRDNRYDQRYDHDERNDERRDSRYYGRANDGMSGRRR
jgi:hypothetical protein